MLGLSKGGEGVDGATSMEWTLCEAPWVERRPFCLPMTSLVDHG